MTDKSKKIDISSTKSMDVTTKKATEMPVNEEAPKIVLNGQKHIKDVNPAEDTNDSASSTKINITDNLASNLKTPIETKKIIEPIEPTASTSTEDEPSDDLTDTSDKNRDESFIDKISDDEEKEESKDSKPTSESDSNEDVDSKEDVKVSDSDAPSQQDDKTDNNKDDKEKADEKPEEQQPNQDSGEEGIVNELAEQAADNKKQKQEAKAQDERNQKIEALIEEKKYFVPIGQITHRRNTRLFIFIIFLVIIIGLFAINLAIDAGMLDIGVEPLTDIIPL